MRRRRSYPFPSGRIRGGTHLGEPTMSKTVIRIAGLSLASALACGLATSANAQLVTHKDLSLAMAVTMAQTAIATCKANGYNVSANVVGRGGEVIVAMRGDATGPHTLENSMKKAYTAKAQRRPSGEFADGGKGQLHRRRAPPQQHRAGPGRAADQGGRGHDRRHRRVRRAGRRQGRGLRQGGHRKGRGGTQVKRGLQPRQVVSVRNRSRQRRSLAAPLSSYLNVGTPPSRRLAVHDVRALVFALGWP